MLGSIKMQFLVISAVLLTWTGTECSTENDFSVVSLPEWRASSEYFTQCFYNKHANLTCDWTRSQKTVPEDLKVNFLESRPLEMEGVACLEFWYLAPATAVGSELRALLKSRSGLVRIWTSPPLPRDAWRQVFLPLNITEPGTRLVFEAIHPVSVEDQTALKQMGVRKGSCGNQCDSNTELRTDDSTHCICSVGQLFCFPSWCPVGQVCSPQRGGSSGISSSGMCTIHHNTDFSTYDGVLIHFVAPCSYVLSKTCSSAEAMPKFSVEVVNEQNGSASQININLGSIRVSLLKRQTRWAVVNGVWKKLPFSQSNGLLNIKSNPAATVMKTDFGLSVSYDNAGDVHINLSSNFSGKVCGLCGNFNQLNGDDFLKPDGTYAENATALAESWQTGETSSSCEAILEPLQCDPLEEAEYASEVYCGRILSGMGPFADCLSVVGAESYFRACVAGMCSAHGDQAVICETFQDYAGICREAGVVLPLWRNLTFCPFHCGENSHYNSCASGCPKVCSIWDISSSCGSCEERCECDSGFKLSGDNCVPAEDCGCWYNGKHYKKGETLVEGHCEQQCQCMGDDAMTCTTMHCSDHEVCKRKNGVKGCFPFKPATCSVYGDQHYITFDKRAYDFQGGCSYTLTTTCGSGNSIQFTVIGHNMQPFQTSTRSKLYSVTLKVDDLHLNLNWSGEIYVDNTQVGLPYATNGTYGSVWVYMRTDDNIILETTFGLKMEMDGQGRLFLQVDERYKYEVCGLCGTYSGHQDDDFVMPGGHNAAEPYEFGDSWRVNDNKCVTHQNHPKQCDDEHEAKKACSAVFQDEFKPCHEHVHPSIYFSSCVYDYCATSGDQHTLCESLKSYGAACQFSGVEVPHWQNNCAEPPTTVTQSPSSTPIHNFCPMKCNFDTNLCEWEQLIQDGFDWTRHSGPTPSNLTGPNKDHTSGAGFYMYLEEDGVTHGESARLLSSVCHYSGPLCLNFWYYMHGSATGMALSVYLFKDNKAVKLWSVMNNQGPEWHLGNVDLRVSSPFQIIMEGIRGSTGSSDVAIDDVSIGFGSCTDAFPGMVGTVLPSITPDVFPSQQNLSGTALPANPHLNTPVPHVSMSTTTAPELPLHNVTAEHSVMTATVPPTNAITHLLNGNNVTEASGLPLHPVCQINCDFEQDLCQWSQMLTDAFDWKQQRGSTPTMTTGPSSDHTTRGGQYLYIEASGVSNGDTACLISLECSDSGPQCLHFWYHLYGSADTMALHIYLLQDRRTDIVWGKRTNQGNMWHLAQVNLMTTGAFQIIIEGRRGSNNESDAAIDNISLQRGLCTDMVTPTNPTPTSMSAFPTQGLRVPPLNKPAATTMPSQTTEIAQTYGSQPPATTKSKVTQLQLQTTTEPATTTGSPQTTKARGTHGPPLSPTTKPEVTQLQETTEPTTATGSPQTTEARETQGPQLSPTTTPEVTQLQQTTEPATTTGSPQTTEITQTHAPQLSTTTKPKVTQLPLQTTTTGLPQTTEAGGTDGPELPTTKPKVTQLQLRTTTGPATTTGSPQTTDARETHGPQLSPTNKPEVTQLQETTEPSTTTGSPQTTEARETQGPQLSPTTTPEVTQLQQTTEPATTTGSPRTTEITQTHGPQLSTTTKPKVTQLPLQTTTTGLPQTTETGGTDGPELPTTKPKVTQLQTTTEPATTTGSPQTTDARETHGPQLSPTNKPEVTQLQETTEPSTTTGSPQTTEVRETHGPQLSPTNKPEVTQLQETTEPTTTTGSPQTTEARETHGPQLSPTTKPGVTQLQETTEPATTTRSPQTTEITQTHGPQLSTTTKPKVTQLPLQTTTNGSPQTTEARETRGPELPTTKPEVTRLQLQTTTEPATTTRSPQTTEARETQGPQLSPTTTPEVTQLQQTTEPATTTRSPQTTEIKQTHGPQLSTTTKPKVTQLPLQTTTTGLPQTTEAGGTNGPESPTTKPKVTQLQLRITTEPATTTGSPQTTDARETHGPQLSPTNKPEVTRLQETTEPATTTRSPQTTEITQTHGPQLSTTTKPKVTQLPLQTTTNGSPQTTEARETRGPELPTTKPEVTRLQKTTEPATTTGSPQTTEARETHGPQLSPTTKPEVTQPQLQETTESATTTGSPQTTEARETHGPQLPTTKPKVTQPQTATEPATTTGSPQTTEITQTHGPQLSTTTKPEVTQLQETTELTTTTRSPQTTEITQTHGPQLSTTTKPEVTQLPLQTPTTGLPQTTEARETQGPQLSPTTKPEVTQPQLQETTEPVTTTGSPQITEARETHGPTKSKVNQLQTMQQQQTVEAQRPTMQFPTPSCAEYSHYTTCVPECSPTCQYLNGKPHCSDGRCVPGCVCDDGFVQKGRACVPIQECGCVDKGGLKHKFNEEWYTSHCSQKCKCEDDDGLGKIDCDDEEECEDVCLRNEMGYYCQSTGFSECTVQGDPEYKTFDGLKHSFEGEDIYVLVRTKNLPSHLPDIYIEILNACPVDKSQHGDSSEEDSSVDEDGSEEHHEKDSVIEFKIRVYNHSVEFKKGRKLFVDGVKTKTPVSPTAGLNIEVHSSHTYLRTDFGLSVEFDGRCKAEIIVPRLYKRKVEGLCGNFDGQKWNDKMKPDGSRAKNSQEFGDSWAV